MRLLISSNLDSRFSNQDAHLWNIHESVLQYQVCFLVQSERHTEQKVLRFTLVCNFCTQDCAPIFLENEIDKVGIAAKISCILLFLP